MACRFRDQHGVHDEACASPPLYWWVLHWGHPFGAFHHEKQQPAMMAGCCFDWKEKGNLYQEVTQPNNQPHRWVGEQHDFLIGSVLKNPTKRCTINNIGYYGSAIYFYCTYDCIIMLLLSMHVDIRQQLFNKGFIYTKTIF